MSLHRFAPRFLGFLLVLALPVLVAVTVAPAARAEEQTFTLTIANNKFEPTELTVPANVKFKLLVRNTDATAEEFESLSLRREKVIAGKSEAIINLGPLPPGRYEFFGEFHPKTARGFLVVK